MDMSEIIGLQRARTLALSEVVGSLNYALDLTEGMPAGHGLRSCWVGMQIGHCLGLDASELSLLYYTILLKDAGCSSNAARLQEIYGSDDRLVKRDFNQVDTDDPIDLGKFVIKHVGLQNSIYNRLSKAVDLAMHGSDFANERIESRCERGGRDCKAARF